MTKTTPYISVPLMYDFEPDSVVVLKRSRPIVLFIYRHADRTLKDQHNDLLFFGRAENAAKSLSRPGIAKELIRIMAWNPKIQTPRKVSEPRNRVLQINFER